MIHTRINATGTTTPAVLINRPLFIADWLDVLFIHFELDPRVLQPSIPFELDVRDGRAYVSLVAFTQKRLRPAFGGRLAAVLTAPLAEHEFLNVRTYVRHRGEAGIYFIAEWIPNRLAAWVGPRTYGLPYRLGELVYANDEDAAQFTGVVRDGRSSAALPYTATTCGSVQYRTSTAGSLAEFLLERYAAFTARRGVRRRFAVDHAPWEQTPVDVELRRSDLLCGAGAWTKEMRLVAAQASPGVRDVTICAPQRLGRTAPREHISTRMECGRFPSPS
jgi:uncharacterized protein YqjF (DUF2071 family)